MASRNIWTYQVRANGRDIAQFIRHDDAIDFATMKHANKPEIEYGIFVDGKRECNHFAARES